MNHEDGSRPSVSPGKIYKSPQRKLVTFFEKSRDQWKAKCRDAKALVKRLKNRVRWLEQSRDRWRHQAQALEAELRQIKVDARSRQKTREEELEQVKKTQVSPLRQTRP